jgi:hypothetical protein
MNPELVKSQRAEFLKEITFKLIDHEPFLVVKFNDGEWNAMVGKSGTNCDNHTYSIDLKVDLLEAYKNLKEVAYISDYIVNFCAFPTHAELANKIGYPQKHFINFALLHDLPYAGQVESLTPELYDFFEALRVDTRHKIFVGPKRIASGVNEFLDVDLFLAVPLLNAYDKVHETLELLLEHSKEDSVVMMSCGFMSCILSHYLHTSRPDVTIIDLGSSIDPVVFGKTRKSQYDRKTLQEFYSKAGIVWPPMEHYYDEIPGWFNYSDLYSDMVKRFPSGHFVEIGAWMGKSASYMGVEIVNSGKDIKFDVIDHFRGSKEEVNTNHKAAKIHNLKGLCVNNLRPFWSTKHNTDPYTRLDNMLKVVVSDSVGASQRYENGSLDFVFIDGGHSYKEVKADIQAWLPKVKKGGVLAGHDYSKSFPGVVQAVRELLPGHKQVSKNCWMIEP